MSELHRVVICEAIRRRALLEFQYTGLHRVVQPYCFGVSAKGVEVLRGTQVGGSSHSRGFGFGKLWTVAKMSEPRILESTFEPDDPAYNPDDSGMIEIRCRI
jgi:hypothetical protein